MAKACSFFWLFIYQIYSITAMLVIIFAYIKMNDMQVKETHCIFTPSNTLTFLWNEAVVLTSLPQFIWQTPPSWATWGYPWNTIKPLVWVHCMYNVHTYPGVLRLDRINFIRTIYNYTSTYIHTNGKHRYYDGVKNIGKHVIIILRVCILFASLKVWLW